MNHRTFHPSKSSASPIKSSKNAGTWGFNLANFRRAVFQGSEGTIDAMPVQCGKDAFQRVPRSPATGTLYTRRSSYLDALVQNAPSIAPECSSQVPFDFQQLTISHHTYKL